VISGPPSTAVASETDLPWRAENYAAAGWRPVSPANPGSFHEVRIIVSWRCLSLLGLTWQDPAPARPERLRGRITRAAGRCCSHQRAESGFGLPDISRDRYP
jgi:hypothetical protein